MATALGVDLRALLAIVGLILAVFGLGLAALGLLTLLTALSEPFPIQIVVGALGLAAGVATLVWSVRLILGRPRREGGLLAPWVLRLAAVFYVGMPIAALVFGTWRDSELPLAWLPVQAGLYLFIGWKLWGLARTRSSSRSAQEEKRPLQPSAIEAPVRRTVGDFEAMYGPGEIYDQPWGVPWREWELSLIYFDPQAGKSFVVGVHRGTLSVAQLKADRQLLAECAAEVIYPPPAGA